MHDASRSLKIHYATFSDHYLFMEGSNELSSSCSRVYVDNLALNILHIEAYQYNL